MKPEPALIIVLLFSSMSARAQANDHTNTVAERTSLGSTVSGHVYLDDTKAPARKAQVYLRPASLLETDAPPNASGNSGNDPITISVETRFDGSFIFTHVTPGSYYIIATAPGYISPFLDLQLAQNRSLLTEQTPVVPQQMKAKNRVLRSLTKIDVQSNLPASADVVLERGAAVSGNISYDDSGPAPGIIVNVLACSNLEGKQTWTPVDLGAGPVWRGPSEISTDDRGNYRIGGLPPGDYVVQAELRINDIRQVITSTESSGSGSDPYPTKLLIYSGSTPRRKDSVIFTLQQGEERTGEDIVIPISRLHTITGKIVAARDGHVVNGGMLILLNASDHSVAGREGLTQDDSSFTFNLVFDGDYILTTGFSADVDFVPAPRAAGDHGPPQFDSQPRHSYGSASMPLHVEGNMDRLTIAVPEPTPKEAQIFQNEMRQHQHQQQPTSTPDQQ